MIFVSCIFSYFFAAYSFHCSNFDLLLMLYLFLFGCLFEASLANACINTLPRGKHCQRMCSFSATGTGELCTSISAQKASDCRLPLTFENKGHPARRDDAQLCHQEMKCDFRATCYQMPGRDQNSLTSLNGASHKPARSCCPPRTA